MSPARRGLALALPTATLGLIGVSFAAVIGTPGRVSGGLVEALSFVLMIAVFAGVGALLMLRRPENVVGSLLALVGLLFALVTAASTASRWALETGGLPKAVGEWLDLPAYSWVIGLGIIGIELPLRLPDGRLPSPRWRWFERVMLVLVAVSFVGMVASPGRVESVPGTANPLGSHVVGSLAPVFLAVIAGFAGGLAGLVVRYRRAGTRDRLRLRWVAFGGAAFLFVYLVTFALQGVVGDDGVAAVANTFVSQVAFAALPISIGYAILRHRLYDIDTVVNRALVYGALTATLGGTYLGSVLLLQLVLGGVTGDSGLAVAASTLATAALFRPARTRIQQFVDRRFYRRRYDAQRTLEAFSMRVRDEVALDALTAELRRVVEQTVQPARVSLWLRRPGGVS